MSPWNRRSFLQAGVFGTAGLAIENRSRLLRSADKPWNAGNGRSLKKFRDPAPTVCRMCPARCGIVVNRDGDRVVQVLGSPGAPTNQGGICSRAFMGLERLYDAERQLRPLRRKGPRGAGEWETISWDQALDEILTRLGRGRNVLHLDHEELLVEDLRGALAWDQILVDRPLPGRPGPGSGAQWYGAPALGPDASRARTILLLGANPFDGRFSVPLVRDLMTARARGASIHLLDSVEGSTGSVGEWHPVSPGTEATVAFGIALILLHRGAYDRERLAEAVSDDPEALREALVSYTPEAVEQATGVSPGTLVSLARAFGERRPALALAPQGSAAEPAAALLNHLAGTVNRPGGMATARGPFFVKALVPDRTPAAFLKGLAEGSERADLYWVVDADPAYRSPSVDAVARALRQPDRVGLLVAMDTHLTETAALADIFLPMATHLESWDLAEGCLPDGRPYLFLQQPVTRPRSEPDKLKDPGTQHLELFEPSPRPLGEARSLPDVLLQLARRRDPGSVPFENSKDFLFEVLRKSWGPGSLEALTRRGIWVSGEGRAPPPAEPVSLVGGIPELGGAPPSDPPETGRLLLVRYEPATLPAAFPNTRWGREIEHRCEALLHPSTARGLGLRSGDTVVIRSEGREARAKARLLQGIHPAAVGLPDGFGHRGGGSVAQALPTAPAPEHRPYLVQRRDFLDNPLGLAEKHTAPGEPIWWAEAGPGVSANALFPFRLGSEGAQDWGPLPVEVRKA